MDRRQKKTRTAIFDAFISLLTEYSYSQITVGQILERADVGRATFYAHFETKDYLLKELCEELFDHLFRPEEPSPLFCCQAPDSVFEHLFAHIGHNDNNILRLLRCRNNELFLGYFKENLKKTAQAQLELFAGQRLFWRRKRQRRQLEAFRICRGKARELVARMEVLCQMERPGRLSDENRRRLTALGAVIRDERPLEAVTERDVVTNYHVRQILSLRTQMLEVLQQIGTNS